VSKMQRNTGNTEEVSSHSEEKGHWSTKWRRNISRAGKKPRADWKKVLANLWSRQKITKKAHAGRGLETIWEMSVYIIVALTMTKYMRVNQSVAEKAKSFYRAIRARLLSIGLQPNGVLSLTDEERRASHQISIVVAVHDGLEVTRRCLSSLEKFSGGAEVVVVDDGSKLSDVRRMLDDFCGRNTWKLVRHEMALGHSRASVMRRK
jgi:hypothetical protein